MAGLRVPALLGAVLSLLSCSTAPAPDPKGHGPQCADIVGAVSLADPVRARDVLVHVAARASLKSHEQSHLIDAVFMRLSGDADRVEALVALASNPSLTTEARMHLAGRLGRLSGDDARVEVLQAMASNVPRGQAVPWESPALGVAVVAAAGGVRVSKLADGGAAAKAGLRVDDLIVGLNDWAVTDMASFRNGARSEVELAGAAEVRVLVRRPAGIATVRVKLK